MNTAEAEQPVKDAGDIFVDEFVTIFHDFAVLMSKGKLPDVAVREIENKGWVEEEPGLYQLQILLEDESTLLINIKEGSPVTACLV